MPKSAILKMLEMTELGHGTHLGSKLLQTKTKLLQFHSRQQLQFTTSKGSKDILKETRVFISMILGEIFICQDLDYLGV